MKFQKGHQINKGRSPSPETRRKLSEVQIGRNLSEETRRRMSAARKGRVGGMLGKYHSIETRRKMSESRKGDKSNFYIDGKGKERNSERAIIMSGVEYTLWRESVFTRDGYKCVWCGVVGGKLVADHIKAWSQFPEIRFAIDNGRTLCEPCHRTTDTYGWKVYNLKRLNIQRHGSSK